MILISKILSEIFKEVDVKDTTGESVPLRGKRIVQRGGTMAGKINPKTGNRGPSERVPSVVGYRTHTGDTTYSHNTRQSVIDETTDLRSLVAKSQGEEHARKIANFLSSNKIEARAADGAIFNPENQTEQPSWGIFVKSSEVVDAGELLHRQKLAHGLSFDPYVKGGK